MTNIEKIDTILNIVLNCEKQTIMSHYDISTELKSLKIDISNKEVYEILHKLEKDDFIKSEINEHLNRLIYYSSTFGGRFFRDNGGYKSQQKSYKRKIIKDKFIITINVINIFAIIILTFFIYRATDKANDNKEEVKILNSKIERLTKTNDSLVYIMNLKKIPKEKKQD